MYSKYQNAGKMDIKSVRRQYLNNIICNNYCLHDDEGYYDSKKNIKYNFTDWTVDYLGNGTYEKINLSTEIINFKLLLKSDKIQKIYLITVLEDILLSDDDNIGKIF